MTGTGDAPALLVLSSVPMAREGERNFLDIKLVEGMERFAALWPGPVRCALRPGPRTEIGYGKLYAPADLGFEVLVRDAAFEQGPELGRAGLVLGSADDHLDLGLIDATTTPVALVIEYTFGTRVRILMLSKRPLFARLKSLLWLARIERRRRTAMRRSAGVQVNGTPAFDAYRAILPKPLVFFDTRLKAAQLPDDAALAARAEAVRAGAPLRLAFSGRLETMKGADHLPEVARALDRLGVPFTFDIYGAGTLSASMQAAIDAGGLADRVRLRGPVPFDDVLVPTLKASVDLFVCCHRQADPSCTYLETLALGVPIVGYANAAFTGVLGLGDVGVAVPMDDAGTAAHAIAALHADRARLAELILNAGALGRAHNYEAVFETRVRHLRSLI